MSAARKGWDPEMSLLCIMCGVLTGHFAERHLWWAAGLSGAVFAVLLVVAT